MLQWNLARWLLSTYISLYVSCIWCPLLHCHISSLSLFVFLVPWIWKYYPDGILGSICMHCPPAMCAACLSKAGNLFYIPPRHHPLTEVFIFVGDYRVFSIWPLWNVEVSTDGTSQNYMKPLIILKHLLFFFFCICRVFKNVPMFDIITLCISCECYGISREIHNVMVSGYEGMFCYIF